MTIEVPTIRNGDEVRVPFGLGLIVAGRSWNGNNESVCVYF